VALAIGIAKKSRIIRDYSSILTDPIDAASLAMLAEAEGHLRYYRSHPERNYQVSRWEPVLRIHMADESLVRWASTAMGETHVTFDKSVGAWYTEARGLRAIIVLTLIRSFIRGEKKMMVDCILKNGKYVVSNDRPCVDCETKFILERRIKGLKNRGLL
jgi:hypothetical protein